MPARLSKYRLLIIQLSFVVITIGVIDIIGWRLYIEHIISVVPGFATMKFNTALCFILLGITLLLQKVHYFNTVSRYRYFIAFFVSAIGFLTFFDRIFDFDYQIDTLFYNYPVYKETGQIEKANMSPQTAFCFGCLGLSLLGIKSRNKNVRIATQYLLHIVTLISFLVIVGYLYGVPKLHSLIFLYSMAVHTAFVFFTLSVAMSLINPFIGFTAVFTGNMIGNLMARRLFSSMIIAILVVGYLRILTHRYNILSVELGIALLTIAFVITSFILIYLTSNILNDYHYKNKIAQDNFRQVVESAPYALMMCDRNSIIQMVNNKTEILYGYDREELIGKHIKQLVPERLQNDSADRRQSFFQLPKTKTYGINEDLFGITKEGKEFPVEAVITPIKSEQGQQLLAFILDVTERKKNEETIKNHLTELQFKNQELEQFNYIASHDLQEPLRTVSNYIHLLEEDYPEQINDEIREHLTVMESAVQRMSTLVRSLLDFGKLGRHKKLKLVNSTSIINEVLTDLGTLIKQKDADVAIECPLPIMYAYETELRQLFQNLINNAIKFSRNGIRPNVHISCSVEDNYYKFTVADNGIGIEEQHYDKIFHIFQRLNKAEEFAGHGIGLANCKKIAEMHGGKIWVERNNDSGSVFIFTIMNFKV